MLRLTPINKSELSSLPTRTVQDLNHISRPQNHHPNLYCFQIPDLAKLNLSRANVAKLMVERITPSLSWAVVHGHGLFYCHDVSVVQILVVYIMYMCCKEYRGSGDSDRHHGTWGILLSHGIHMDVPMHKRLGKISHWNSF